MERLHQEKEISSSSKLSHVLGAKAYSLANMRSLLLKAKGLFSYIGGCLILQQNLGSLLQKAKDSSSCLTCWGLSPILQQIQKAFRKALRVSICSRNITHYEISINCGTLASIHPSVTWSTTTSNFMIWHSATSMQFVATYHGQVTFQFVIRQQHHLSFAEALTSNWRVKVLTRYKVYAVLTPHFATRI